MKTTQITVDGFTLDVSVAELLHLVGARAAEGVPQPIAARLPAKIGDPLQGGIYVGPMFDAEVNEFVHLIAAAEHLSPAEWEDAKRSAEAYRGGKFSDWHLPTKSEAMTALLHAQSHFEKGWYWTATPRSDYAWAVGFEDGLVSNRHRHDEFRVRPVRRFIPSSL